MPGAKEIRGKIRSIKNTQKITKAMEMVAASKMRKAQERIEAARPYSDKIRVVIGHLSKANPDYRHPFLEYREKKRIGYIVVSTDRGLCGGLNTNLFKIAIADMVRQQEQGLEMDLCMVGAKGLGFFQRYGGNIISQVTHLGDIPRLTDLIGSVKTMLDAYSKGQIDRLYLIHNQFINTMTQRPRMIRLLPVETEDGEELQRYWDYIYEPDAADLLDDVLMRYIETQVYRGVLDNLASEQAARMVAMKSATDNAGEIIDKLQLDANKARQAAITQEISEIVGGAAAV